ncbi:DOMAIN PROTEIN putative-RELATED [Salix koriyanagi]|uniref:KAT8 regulatory NSL complex subunit 2 n=1 Tax=Salix koriyanagi TaxID=2511006 RepID=A0A9Q0PN61_9ROSI|nr:DOMAIN PROTEIN putative-RELATED [Salix koriyanagi]
MTAATKKYGVSPFKEDNQKQEQQKQGGGVGVLQRENEESGANIEVIGENNTNVSDLKSNHRCLFVGCKLKAMALTSFCHLHILSEAKQKLYKPCGYVFKRRNGKWEISVRHITCEHVTEWLLNFSWAI